MRNTIIVTIAALAACACSLFAHHSYADYDRNIQVSLEGDVKSVQWVNPHITIQLETKDKGDYSVEFNAPSFMQRSRIDRSAFIKAGDRVIIKGSVNRNPEKKILTLVREIYRPSDGWEWLHPDVARNVPTR